jgi:hypothetical protein
MTIFITGGVQTNRDIDIRLLVFRRTCDFRIDDCPRSERVTTLETEKEREQRVKQLIRKAENGGN